MYLYYDRISKMFTLDMKDEGVVFLGPSIHALVQLSSVYGFTESQAREAVLQAIFNTGAAVDLAIIKKIASKESNYFKRNVA